MRPIIRLSFLMILLLFLPGCWDRTEINDLAFVLSTAFDLEKDGKIRTSVLVPLPGQMGGASGGGGGTAGEKSYYIDSEVGNDIREAQEKLQRRMSRRLFLAHRRTVLIGEDLAKTIGIRHILDPIVRSHESRMTTYIIITKGKAYDLMQATPRFERFPAEAIRELGKGKNTMGLNMKDVIVSINSTGSDAVAVYMGIKESENGGKPSKEVEVLGYAQFRGDKMVDTLEERSALALSWLKNKSVKTWLTIKPEDHCFITAHIFDSKTKTDARVRNGKLQFDINVNVKTKVLSSTCDYDLNRKEQMSTLEQQLSSNIKASIEETLNKIKKSKTDPAQLGTLVWRTYPKLWKDQFEPMWPDALHDAQFNIQVKASFSDTGMSVNNVVGAGEKK